MGDRLFTYDRRILSNSIRAALDSWPDRLIAVMGLVMLIGGVRVSLLHRPSSVATWAAIAVGGMVGAAASRSIASRLAFHAFDGSLAADALRRSTRRRYVMAWHALALAALAGATVVARPSLLVVSLPSYLGGAVVAAVVSAWGGGFDAVAPTSPTRVPWRTISAGGQRPIAGVVSAALLLGVLAPLALALGLDSIVAVAGLGAGMLAATMTVVDHAVVRFLTITGHTSGRIIARQGRAAGLFLVLAPLGCALTFDVMIAAVVAAVSSAALLVMMIRILAYRLQSKRAADLLVSCVLLLLIVVAASSPTILPLLVLAVLWLLHRRAATATWLLA